MICGTKESNFIYHPLGAPLCFGETSTGDLYNNDGFVSAGENGGVLSGPYVWFFIGERDADLLSYCRLLARPLNKTAVGKYVMRHSPK